MRSNKAVVVGYNGKEPASEALTWAANEANRRNARLVVLYAANYPGMALPPGPGLWEREPGALDAAREVCDRGVSEALAVHPELSVSGRTVVTSPTQALVEESDDASLLVVGSRGRGPVTGAFLGSVSLIVATGGRCPVVVVKPGCAETMPGARSRVVVGTDGSPNASSAVTFAADSAASNAAQLEVICCTGEVSVPVVSAEMLRQSAENILELICASLKKTHPDLQVSTRMEEGRPEPVLIEASADAGLLVVGSRGRGAFKSMVAGSVALAVVHEARCPVAVVGPHATRAT